MIERAASSTVFNVCQDVVALDKKFVFHIENSLVPQHFRPYLSRKLGCSYWLFESDAQHLGPPSRSRA